MAPSPITPSSLCPLLPDIHTIMLRALYNFLSWKEDPKPTVLQLQKGRSSGRARKGLGVRPTEKYSPPLLRLPHPIEPSPSHDKAIAPETPAPVVPLAKRRALFIEDSATQNLLSSIEIKLPALRDNRSSGKKVFTGPLRNQLIRAQARNRRSCQVALQLRPESLLNKSTHRVFSDFLSSDTSSSDDDEFSGEEDLSWIPSEYLAVRHILEDSGTESTTTQEESAAPYIYPSVIIFNSDGPSHPRPIILTTSTTSTYCSSSSIFSSLSEPTKSMEWLICHRLKSLQDEAALARTTAATRAEADRVRIETSLAVRAIQMDWADMQKAIFRPLNPLNPPPAPTKNGIVTQEKSFLVHEKKWSQLLSSSPTPFDTKPLPVLYFPFPVLSPGLMGHRCTNPLTHPDSPGKDITMLRILEFIFHPARINALPMIDPRVHGKLTAKTLVLMELQKWCRCRCESRKRMLSRVQGEDRERLEKGWKAVREMLIQVLAYFDMVDAPDSEM